MRYLLIVTLVLVGHWGFAQKSPGDAVKSYKANKVRQVSQMKIKSLNDLSAHASYWGLSKNDELRLIKDYLNPEVSIGKNIISIIKTIALLAVRIFYITEMIRSSKPVVH